MQGWHSETFSPGLALNTGAAGSHTPEPTPHTKHSTPGLSSAVKPLPAASQHQGIQLNLALAEGAGTHIPSVANRNRHLQLSKDRPAQGDM